MLSHSKPGQSPLMTSAVTLRPVAELVKSGAALLRHAAPCGRRASTTRIKNRSNYHSARAPSDRVATTEACRF